MLTAEVHLDGLQGFIPPNLVATGKIARKNTQFEEVKKGDQKQHRDFVQNHAFYAKNRYFLQRSKKFCAKVNFTKIVFKLNVDNLL